jgi:hypothetical protein
MMPSELTTLLTDYILALFAFIIFLIFIKIKTNTKGKRWIEFSYLFLSCSAFLAGTWHGFHNTLPIWAFWVFSMFFLFASSFCILFGTLLLFFKNRDHYTIPLWPSDVVVSNKTLRLLGLILTCFKTFLFFSIFSLNIEDFGIPYLDFSLSLLVIFCLALIKAISKKHFSYLWICTGIFFSFFGGILWMMKIPKYPHFNHNDVFHMLQTICVLLTYLGYKEWIKKTL